MMVSQTISWLPPTETPSGLKQAKTPTYYKWLIAGFPEISELIVMLWANPVWVSDIQADFLMNPSICRVHM